MRRIDWQHFDWSSLARGWGADLRVGAILLTRVPLRLEGDISAAMAAAGLRSAPVIGLALGLAAGAAYGLASLIGLAPYLAALLALGLAIAATGGLHEDGLADCADALAGGTAAARLAIMRDSRIGSYGVLALILSVGLRAGALAQLAQPWVVLAALAAAAAASRGLLPLVPWALEPARSTGLGRLVASPSQEVVATAAALGAIAALFLLGPLAGVVALAAALAAAWGIAALARSRLGGYTGDVLGAIQQAAETAILVVAAIFAQ
ncbi:MAG: adenosylcobinamide-GDP ribazoletransferase [Alphaproteobacteria bacterium]